MSIIQRPRQAEFYCPFKVNADGTVEDNPTESPYVDELGLVWPADLGPDERWQDAWRAELADWGWEVFHLQTDFISQQMATTVEDRVAATPGLYVFVAVEDGSSDPAHDREVFGWAVLRRR